MNASTPWLLCSDRGKVSYLFLALPYISEKGYDIDGRVQTRLFNS